jgi:septal ring factor EnvC (AmiA/AmiB activator)
VQAAVQPLQQQLNAVQQQLGAVQPMQHQLDAMQQQLGAVQQQLDALQQQLGALQPMQQQLDALQQRMEQMEFNVPCRFTNSRARLDDTVVWLQGQGGQQPPGAPPMTLAQLLDASAATLLAFYGLPAGGDIAEKRLRLASYLGVPR